MSSWRVLFLVLCSVLTPALCCNWIKHFGHLNGESLKLIKDMGGPLTEEQSPVPFPYRLYTRIQKEEVQSQLVFIRDSLKMISDLYSHDNLTPVTWDKVKLEHFLSSIHRQTVELNRCVPPSKRVNRKLRNYYRRLTRCTLDRTCCSAASWELIRKETKQHLGHLDLLMNPIKANDAASRGRSTPSQPIN
ncbi:interferon phi 1 [Notolabrus celidotus]|uniref:interferon phi 1 n=1 Tax=Notolabrus celidotus TaxID=1203425 RepID=UPI00148F5A40|nr:interferon phi 1 [Notolabrus celidotus]